METMVLYPLDLSFVKDDAFVSRFIQYHVENTGESLKDVLDSIRIAYTSYAYARTNGFLNSKKVLSARVDYFNLSLETDEL